MASKQLLVDTLAAVKMNNGLVRMMFVGQDAEDIFSNEDKDRKKNQTRLQQCITMPLPGFLYAVSVLDKFMNDKQMQTLLEQAKESVASPEVVDEEMLNSADNTSEEALIPNFENMNKII